MGKKVDTAKIGRMGGLKSRANLTADEAGELGRRAVQARWDAYYAEHPEKLKAKQEREARKGKVPRGRPAKKAAKKRPGT